jgi:Thoeris protein ThsB, TIR-like domain
VSAEPRGVCVYLSFDVDYDADLGDRLLKQSQRGGSGFHIASLSEAGKMTDRWHEGVRRRVRAADELIVICGEHTATSDRVNAELRIALEEQKPYLLLWGRRERMCSMPIGVKRTACMYSWTGETLLHLVAQTLRDARPLEVPENCKRPVQSS